MAGVRFYGNSPISGLVRTYETVVINAELPDNTIGLYAKAAGNVTVMTVAGHGPHVFPMAAGSFLPGEFLRVIASTIDAANLFACIR